MGLDMLDFADRDFRNSRLIRLVVLKQLQQKGLLTGELEWRDMGAHREFGIRKRFNKTSTVGP